MTDSLRARRQLPIGGLDIFTMRSSVHSFVTSRVNMMFRKRRQWFCCKWSTSYGDNIFNFESQAVKDQGHTMPRLDLEAWRRHHSRPLPSSMFSQFETYSTSTEITKVAETTTLRTSPLLIIA